MPGGGDVGVGPDELRGQDPPDATMLVCGVVGWCAVRSGFGVDGEVPARGAGWAVTWAGEEVGVAIRITEIP